MQPAEILVGRTLASDVLYRLRQDILQGAFAPNARLRFEALREAYGVSFSTLREALAHLTQEGLVAAEGQRGFRVAPVSRADLYDLCETRVVIERAIIARALPRGDAAWEASLRNTLAELRRIVETTLPAEAASSPAWQAAHRKLHETILAPCGSPTMLFLRERLYNRALRYRQLALRAGVSMDKSIEDHEELVEAALRRDVARTSDLAEQHIRWGTSGIDSQAAQVLQEAG